MVKMLVNFSSVEEKVIFNRICDVWLSRERKDNLEDYIESKDRVQEIKDEVRALRYNKDRFIDEESWDYAEWGVFVEYVSKKSDYEGTLMSTNFESWEWDFSDCAKIIGTLEGFNQNIILDIDDLLDLQELVEMDGAGYRDPKDTEMVWGCIVGQVKLMITKEQLDKLIEGYIGIWVYKLAAECMRKGKMLRRARCQRK